MAQHIVATVDEIPAGQRKIVEIAGRSIGVFNIEGEYFALRNRCPHQAGPLCEGLISQGLRSTRPGDYQLLADKTIRCPWHGWEFDLKTGQSWFDPAQVRVKPYPVTVATDLEVAKGACPAKGPHVAETYPVSIEQTYIVVEI